MRRYHDNTILLLQCFAKNWKYWDDTEKKLEIELILKDVHWSIFFLFTPARLDDNKLNQLIEAVNALMIQNTVILTKDFNQSSNQGSLINFGNQTQQEKKLSNFQFRREDAALILFMLKLYSSLKQSSSSISQLFEKLCSNFLIPLYHNRNFQVAILTYMVVPLLLMSPFLPHILAGMLGTLIAGAILTLAIYGVYQAFEYFSIPESRVEVEDNIPYSPS